MFVPIWYVRDHMHDNICFRDVRTNESRLLYVPGIITNNGR